MERFGGQEVVIAHDYLTQRGGAERVALELALQTGAREIVTSAHVPEQTFAEFADHRIVTSRDPLIRLLRKDPRRALPILSRVWDRMEPVDADVVVCSTSGWAHGVPVTPGTRKVVYCHNPARWLYQPQDYTTDQSQPVRVALSLLSPSLRAWDQRAARTADVYLANSSAVAARIATVYGITAEIIPPPVSVDTNGDLHEVPGLPERFFVTVGRARGYKGTARLVEAFAALPDQHLVLVGIGPTPDLPANVTALGRVPDAQLRWLYTQARALVSVSHEDFGLTPIEANAFGTPCLLLEAGGFLDSTQPGVSGLFIADEQIPTIRAAVRSFPDGWDHHAIRAHAATFAPEVFIGRIQTAVARALGQPVAHELSESGFHRASAGRITRNRLSISSTAIRAASLPRR